MARGMYTVDEILQTKGVVFNPIGKALNDVWSNIMTLTMDDLARCESYRPIEWSARVDEDFSPVDDQTVKAYEKQLEEWKKDPKGSKPRQPWQDVGFGNELPVYLNIAKPNDDQRLSYAWIFLGLDPIKVPDYSMSILSSRAFTGEEFVANQYTGRNRSLKQFSLGNIVAPTMQRVFLEAPDDSAADDAIAELIFKMDRRWWDLTLLPPAANTYFGHPRKDQGPGAASHIAELVKWHNAVRALYRWQRRRFWLELCETFINYISQHKAWQPLLTTENYADYRKARDKFREIPLCPALATLAVNLHGRVHTLLGEQPFMTIPITDRTLEEELNPVDPEEVMADATIYGPSNVHKFASETRMMQKLADAFALGFHTEIEKFITKSYQLLDDDIAIMKTMASKLHWGAPIKIDLALNQSGANMATSDGKRTTCDPLQTVMGFTPQIPVASASTRPYGALFVQNYDTVLQKDTSGAAAVKDVARGEYLMYTYPDAGMFLGVNRGRLYERRMITVAMWWGEADVANGPEGGAVEYVASQGTNLTTPNVEVELTKVKNVQAYFSQTGVPALDVNPKGGYLPGTMMYIGQYPAKTAGPNADLAATAGVMAKTTKINPTDYTTFVAAANEGTIRLDLVKLFHAVGSTTTVLKLIESQNGFYRRMISKRTFSGVYYLLDEHGLAYVMHQRGAMIKESEPYTHDMSALRAVLDRITGGVRL